MIRNSKTPCKDLVDKNSNFTVSVRFPPIYAHTQQFLSPLCAVIISVNRNTETQLQQTVILRFSSSILNFTRKSDF